jgi:diguanylate cyclase (GGDEF)-like protein/PAS domain S-box-containing protein
MGVAAALGRGTLDPVSAEALVKRRMLPLSLVLLAALGLVHWLAERAALYAHDTGIVLTTVAGAAGISLVMLVSARAVRRVETGREHVAARYQRLVEQLPLVVYVDEIADNSPNVYTSPQVEEILGYTVAEWVENEDLFVKLLHREDRERVLRQVRESNRSGTPFRSEYRLVSRDGRVVWFRDESVIVRDEAGTPLYIQGYLLDVTERKRVEARLEQLAYTDSLTGLANREHFQSSLAAELATGGDDVAVVFLDLDDFKTVNDSLGHAAGDELLRTVGERLAAVVRTSDLVGRLGGDEFGIIVRTADRLRLAALTERIQLALRSTAAIDGTPVRVAASIGIACSTDSTDLLRDADVAMYSAKGEGGDTARFFEPAMREAVLERLELVGALERPEVLDELRLEYQPTFDLTDGHVVTVEALLRWERPNRGLVPPRQFIPVAEQTGAILPIGRWVLDRACEQVARWNAGRERPVGLNVNLSARQLGSPDLITEVASALARGGLPAELLTLELTETVLMTSEGEAAANLPRLKELGVRLAIDDFGTGYSSFSYLRRLAVDTIKIDRSFIGDLGGDTDRTLLRAMVRLAGALGVELVAEGIERDAQIHALRELRCRHGQGFLLARPLGPEALESLLAADRPEALRLRLVGG